MLLGRPGFDGRRVGAHNAVGRILKLIDAGDTPGDRAVASWVLRYLHWVTHALLQHARRQAGPSSYELMDHERCARS